MTIYYLQAYYNNRLIEALFPSSDAAIAYLEFIEHEDVEQQGLLQQPVNQPESFATVSQGPYKINAWGDIEGVGNVIYERSNW